MRIFEEFWWSVYRDVFPSICRVEAPGAGCVDHTHLQTMLLLWLAAIVFILIAAILKVISQWKSQ